MSKASSFEKKLKMAEKKYFHQLSGEHNTRQLVKMHNTQKRKILQNLVTSKLHVTEFPIFPSFFYPFEDPKDDDTCPKCSTKRFLGLMPFVCIANMVLASYF